jgi:hypothetical protein
MSQNGQRVVWRFVKNQIVSPGFRELIHSAHQVRYLLHAIGCVDRLIAHARMAMVYTILAWVEHPYLRFGTTLPFVVS